MYFQTLQQAAAVLVSATPSQRNMGRAEACVSSRGSKKAGGACIRDVHVRYLESRGMLFLPGEVTAPHPHVQTPHTYEILGWAGPGQLAMMMS